MRGPAPEEEYWIGRTVAAWISARLGRPVGVYLGWAVSGAARRPSAQAAAAPCALRLRGAGGVQKKLRPLLRAVVTAFPQAQVELWATDEHRISLKPILHEVWRFDAQRPISPVEYRYERRYLVGFVHPALGRTVFHLASTVNISLFEVELVAFARQVGAGPRKQIVLILDRVGWHSSVRLRVPEHVHLLFLPAYSPELQPAEHLWALTDTALANRHFASIGEFEDVQAERCVALQALPDLIRSTTWNQVVVSTSREASRPQVESV